MGNFENAQQRDANRQAWEGALKKLEEMFGCLSSHAATLLRRELDGFSREVSLFPDDASLWKTGPGIANSAGNLTFHVAGNLRYFVGKVLGGEAYIRDRDAEFGRRSGTREELLSELQKTSDVVRKVLSEFPESRLTEEFPDSVMGLRLRTDLFLLHLCVHAGFHLGQVGYLRRMVTAEPVSSGPLPLKPLSF
jgi:uncharacterized damage-inducible protein DinB